MQFSSVIVFETKRVVFSISTLLKAFCHEIERNMEIIQTVTKSYVTQRIVWLMVFRELIFSWFTLLTLCRIVERSPWKIISKTRNIVRKVISHEKTKVNSSQRPTLLIDLFRVLLDNCNPSRAKNGIDFHRLFVYGTRVVKVVGHSSLVWRLMVKKVKMALDAQHYTNCFANNELCVC